MATAGHALCTRVEAVGQGRRDRQAGQGDRRGRQTRAARPGRTCTSRCWWPACRRTRRASWPATWPRRRRWPTPRPRRARRACRGGASVAAEPRPPGPHQPASDDRGRQRAAPSSAPALRQRSRRRRRALRRLRRPPTPRLSGAHLAARRTRAARRPLLNCPILRHAHGPDRTAVPTVRRGPAVARTPDAAAEPAHPQAACCPRS